MSNDKKRAANARYQATLDYIGMRIPPVKGAAIRAAATEAGQPLAAYIVQACFERMERDGFKPDPPADPPKDDK